MDYGGADIDQHLARYPSVDSIQIPLLKKDSSENVTKILKLNQLAKSAVEEDWIEVEDLSSPYRIAVLNKGRPAAKVQILRPLITAGQLASISAYLYFLGKTAFAGEVGQNLVPKLFFAGQVSDYRLC